MGFAYQKVKSVAKDMEVKGPQLTKLVLATTKKISDIVGATLGPGGSSVLIERQEWQLPAMITKDGVTVFRNLGFDSALAHVVMEAMRDAAVRTANEAGDGTTTATVLAAALVDLIDKYTTKNPSVSPQKVIRAIQALFDKVILPRIASVSSEFLKLDLGKPEDAKRYGEMLWNVAKVSANGDTALADAVMQCYAVVGDDGNVTLTEVSGPSGYEVEPIQGYPIAMGYEDSCMKYSSKFITDQANQRVVLDKPIFVVYHGAITEIQSVQMLMEQIGDAWQASGFRHNVVLVATGFSEQVVGLLALNMSATTSINVFPLLAPMSPVPNGQLGFLRDICAVTGAPLLDPINAPLDRARLEFDTEGHVISGPLGMHAKMFEANRFRSVILSEDVSEEIPGSIEHSQEVQDYIELVKGQSKQAASDADSAFFAERVGKLTGGIAKLKVIGASNGELRERRDRAEDAVCAVRGAIKHGVVPGGGWMLLDLIRALDPNKLEGLDRAIATDILVPTLRAPFNKIYQNLGYTNEETEEIFNQMFAKDFTAVYDAYEQKFVPKWDSVLDSTPAVREAIRSSISIASLLGTLGGAVVFKRDIQLERSEAKETAGFLREGSGAETENPANDRGM